MAAIKHAFKQIRKTNIEFIVSWKKYNLNE